MESQPQNPEFMINPENFHSCTMDNNQIHQKCKLYKFNRCLFVCFVALHSSKQLWSWGGRSVHLTILNSGQVLTSG